jgi:hypothetical protein
MRVKLSSLIVWIGLLAAGSLQSAFAEETSPNTLKLQGETTFELELRRASEGEACLADWYFATHRKSTDFELVRVRNGANEKFVILKKEIWRTETNEGCENGELVERIDVSALDPSDLGLQLYSLSVNPEDHGPFGDAAVVETSGSLLKLCVEDEYESYEPVGPCRYYNVLSGELMFFADQWGLVTKRGMAGLDDSARFVGMTILDQENAAGAIGSITYASRSGILQRAEIRLTPLGSLRQYPDVSLSFTSPDAPAILGTDTIRRYGAVTAWVLFRVEPAVAGDLKIRFNLNGDVDVYVPMKGDQLEFSRASAPPGFMVTPIQ